MAFLFITADFPVLKPTELKEIFERLESDNWLKMHTHDGHTHTIWFSSLDAGLPLRDAIEEAKDNFNSCCTPYCKPRIRIDFGDNSEKETRHCSTASLSIVKYGRQAACEPAVFIVKNPITGAPAYSPCC